MVVDTTNTSATTADEAVAYFGTLTCAHYAGKREQERIVAEGRVPSTIVPAT